MRRTLPRSQPAALLLGSAGLGLALGETELLGEDGNLQICCPIHLRGMRLHAQHWALHYHSPHLMWWHICFVSRKVVSFTSTARAKA